MIWFQIIKENGEFSNSEGGISSAGFTQLLSGCALAPLQALFHRLPKSVIHLLVAGFLISKYIHRPDFFRNVIASCKYTPFPPIPIN